jgi:MraZ protein
VAFLGTFDYAMDERGRLPLPPKYRDAFRDGIVISQGRPDRCLRLYTQEAFERQAADYLAQPAMRRKGRVLRRGLFPTSYEAELDKQNRLLIPSHLRDYAGLSGKVLVVGAGEWVEIWAPDAFDDEMEQVARELEATLESIEPRE